MNMSWLWAHRSHNNLDRRYGLSSSRLCTVGLLLLLGASQAFSATAPDPAIHLIQNAGDVESNGDGTFTVPITLAVRNVGNEELAKIQLTDDLDIFGMGRMVRLSTPRVLSGNLTLNTGFDGRSDTRLLQGVDTLLPGGEARLRFYVTFDPGNESGPFFNRIVAWSEGKDSGIAAEDDVRCEFWLPGQPAISLRKTVGEVTSNGYGTFLMPVILEVINTGTEELIKLQIKDDLDIFGPGHVVDISSIAVLASNVTLNPGFNGLDDIRLLDGIDALPVGSTAKLGFDVTFEPGGWTGPYTNRAVAWAEGKYSGTQLDVEARAVVTLPLRPEIEFEKTAGTVVNNQNGTYTVPITLDLLNVGQEEIIKLQLKDDLDIFGTGQVVDVGTVEVIAGNLTLNVNFNGKDDIRLLTGVDTVAVGNRVTLRFPATFDPAGEPGPFTNWAIAWTEGRDSGIGIDIGAMDIIELPPDPRILLQKEAGEVSENADGSLSVPITLTVTNSGDEVLKYLQLTDILDFFGSGELLDVEDISSEDVSVNEDYDGDLIQTLLMGMDTLPIDAVATVTFSVKFNRGDEFGPLVNTATADAIGVISDLPVSASASASIELPVIPPPPPKTVITVSKEADRNYVVRGDLVGYEVTVTNLTDMPLDDVVVTDTPPPGFQFVEGSALLVRSGPDGRFNTVDDENTTIATSGTRPIVFEPFDLAPNEKVIARYLMRVSTGVANGEHINRVTVDPPPNVPVESEKPVTVVGDPIFEKTTVIGKVFDDRNKDGWQDKDEPGIPGVRLATVDGLTIETDAKGRYHLADVDVDRFERGANFIIKVDLYSLPDGAKFISENPRVVRLTQSTMSKINFAVELPIRRKEACFESCIDEQGNISHHKIIHEMCVAAPAYDPGFFSGTLSTSVDDSSRTSCTPPHPGPVESSTTARRVTVSGGLFGCNTLVADTLPGRQADVDSDVTVYETGINTESVDLNACPMGIVPGEYPIQVQTNQGSVVHVTSAGDVIRKNDPTNFEHIIVTPFRDETDNTVISALRIINDGIDPMLPEITMPIELDTWSRRATATADSLVIDPRLDVLALQEAIVDDQGNLVKSIEFAIYTNYARYISTYSLEVYGSSEHGFGKTLLKTADPFTKYEFDVPIMFESRVDGKPRNLSLFTDIEYVLKVSDCPKLGVPDSIDPFDERQCNVDVTADRVLQLRAGDVAESVLHDRHELWGMTNLAVQNIPVNGGRMRVSDLTESAGDDVEINGSNVPLGRLAENKNSGERPFVLEEHVRPGRHSYSWGLAGSSIPVSIYDFSADAHDIAVDGGLFGCGQVVVPLLAGRSSRNSNEHIQAVTVAADPAGSGASFSGCTEDFENGSYPIRIRTREGSIIHISSAGDVTSVRSPFDPKNRQQIVATPFRDYTDSSVVSAIRISNEGFPAEAAIGNPAMDPVADMVADPFFIVALANLTVGQNNVSGNILTLGPDDHFDGTTFVDGRIAMYAKGKIQGKYLVTAQLDSTEDELRNLGDNLKRIDRRRIFRQLDPDRYYPVYGDDSTTTTDVDTQGALYVRVDWDKNSALWGNYNTGMTDTELMQYNRSLYGARFEHESQATTASGDATTELTVFGSEAQSEAAHVTFQATGGSLYYLRHTDVVQGSEKIWIEVRRRDTEQVVEREVLIEGRDYEVDPIQGRIILRRPLSQVVSDRQDSIIRSAPLEGDEVYLLADYEYVPVGFDAGEVTYGGRGRAWLGDHVAVGATSVTDERNGTNYEMSGADLTLKRSEKTYLRAEVAHSRARQSDANFMSIDGGLTFQPQVSVAAGESLKGDALALDLRIDLAEFSERLKGDIRGWWKERDAQFSTGRLGQGEDITDSGVELHTKIGADFKVVASYSDFERQNLSRERVTRVQASGTFGASDRLTAGLELRHEKVETFASGPDAPVSKLIGAAADGEALLIGTRLGYEVSDDTTVYGAVQTVADDKGIYRKNDLFSLGLNRKVSEALAMSLEVSDGDRGSAVTAGVDVATDNGLNFNVSGGVGSGAISQFSSHYAIAEGHELYGSYAVDPDRTVGARNLLTLGQRRSFGNAMSIFAESQFGKDDRYANVAHVFGLNFEGTENWRYSASLQFSDNDLQGLTFDRQALSFGAYRNKGTLKVSSRVEFREDEGVSVHSRQYLSSNSFTKIVDADSRWLGQLNLSWTDDKLNGGHDARFVEFDIGHAYRPANNDRFNLIGKYSFLYDLATEGQAEAQVAVRPDERSHLISVEGIYDFENRWELAGKIAARKGDRRLVRDSGGWEEFGLRMVSARARYHISNEWDGLAEYRWLSDITGDNDRHGALLALYRNMSDHFNVGVGFNFTDFDDRLKIDSYRNSGWFIDLVGKY